MVFPYKLSPVGLHELVKHFVKIHGNNPHFLRSYNIAFTGSSRYFFEGFVVRPDQIKLDSYTSRLMRMGEKLDHISTLSLHSDEASIVTMAKEMGFFTGDLIAMIEYGLHGNEDTNNIFTPDGRKRRFYCTFDQFQAAVLPLFTDLLVKLKRLEHVFDVGVIIERLQIFYGSMQASPAKHVNQQEFLKNLLKTQGVIVGRL